MSTYWRLRCAEHQISADGDGVNHGQGALRELASLRAPLAALLAAPGAGNALDISAFGVPNDEMLFAVEHAQCPLELLSEYGDVEPLDKPCEATWWLPVDGDRPQCSRQDKHSGKHQTRVRRQDGLAVYYATVEWG